MKNRIKNGKSKQIIAGSLQTSSFRLIRETMLPKIKEIVRKKYVGYLQQGFVFKKYIKNSEHRVESYVRRKWVLDSSEIAFRVFDCDRPDKQRAKNGKHQI